MPPLRLQLPDFNSAVFGLDFAFVFVAEDCAQEPKDGIVELIDDALFHGDDGVVGDVDVLGADFRAALGDVAVAETALPFEEWHAVDRVERMHIQRCSANDETWSDKRVFAIVVA